MMYALAKNILRLLPEALCSLILHLGQAYAHWPSVRGLQTLDCSHSAHELLPTLTALLTSCLPDK